MNKRIEIIEILQCIAVLLVVLGHSIETPHSNILFFHLLHDFIYSFHMPLFMLISGYLFYNDNKKRAYLQFIKHKAEGLLLPYFILSTFVFLPRTFLNKYNVNKIDLSIDGYIHQLIYPWDNVITQFWFLPTLFLIFIIAPIIKVNKKIFFCILLIAFYLHIYSYNCEIKFLNINGICFYLFYFIMGAVNCLYKDILVRVFQKNQRQLLVIIILSNILFLSNILDGIYFKILLAFFNSILACVFAKIYIVKKYKFLDFCKGYSYHIYLLSWLPLKVIVIIFYKIASITTAWLYVLEFFASVLIPLKLKNVIEILFIEKYR